MMDKNDVGECDYDTFVKQNPRIVLCDPSYIPDGFVISTMTVTCKLPLSFDVYNIASKLELSKDFIQTVGYGKKGEIFKTLLKRKPRRYSENDNEKKKNTKFYNQVTIAVNSGNISMNIKLFRNGSIQITGCIKISNVVWGLNKLFNILKKIQSDDDPVANPIEFLSVINLLDNNIAMINSNFAIGFRIDRERLFMKLHNDGYDCSFDPSRHAAVIMIYETSKSSITYSDNNKKIRTPSILVFDSGKIIITGVRNYRQLMECYKFICCYLIENYVEIVLIIVE